MPSPLAAKRCIPSPSDTPPLAGDALLALSAQLGGPGVWKVIDEHRRGAHVGHDVGHAAGHLLGAPEQVRGTLLCLVA